MNPIQYVAFDERRSSQAVCVRLLAVCVASQDREGIHPEYTRLIWEKLEERNPEFFKAYYDNMLIEQTQEFNRVFLEHVQQIRLQQIQAHYNIAHYKII